MTHAIARHFINQEVTVFGKSDCDEHPNCLGGGFLVGIEDGFVLFAMEKGGKPDLAITLNSIETVATVDEEETDTEVQKSRNADKKSN